jgi:hypothetical protein
MLFQQMVSEGLRGKLAHHIPTAILCQKYDSFRVQPTFTLDLVRSKNILARQILRAPSRAGVGAMFQFNPCIG